MSDNTFKPAWWLQNPHMQTIWPCVCRRSISLETERERLELPDGDFIDLEWSGRHESGPIVILLHGLEGSIDSHYAKGMMQAFLTQGWRSVLIHFRGCSGEPNRLSRNYHSGDTGDVNLLVHILKEREPQTKMTAVGVSLGGNVLLKWLGETGAQNQLTAAIAISVPFQLNVVAKHVTKGFSKLYQWYFIKCLRKRLSHKFRLRPTHLDKSAFDDVNTMYDFDERITAPLHGFSSAEDYYEQCSCRQFLHNINVPTLILHAKDDPLMTSDVIPSQEELSDKITLELSETGGHVGFVAGKYPWRAEYWLEQRIIDFFAGVLNQSKK